MAAWAIPASEMSSTNLPLPATSFVFVRLGTFVPTYVIAGVTLEPPGQERRENMPEAIEEVDE
jgi:hypothetical protein